MSRASLINEVLQARAPSIPRGMALVMLTLGLGGLGVGFFGGDPAAGWAALLTGAVLVMGLGVVGALFSAMFQLTGARWGRSYRRLAEVSVILMPLGLGVVLALLAGGGAYLPWVHEHPHAGGKAVWLTRGFWDLRVLGALVVAYLVALRLVYFSVRRDFCVEAVRERYRGIISRFVSREITDANADAERVRCSRKLDVMAPVLAIVYPLMFSLLGFDLIMALDPDWFSTLFGAWYFVGNIFFGLALLAIVSAALGPNLGLGRFLGAAQQSDLATLLLAFCLLNADFFWNQYLTIWYANLPEETGYVMARTSTAAGPWRALSVISLASFFLIPFIALLFRRVKRSRALLVLVALVAASGIFLARFIEIAPELLQIEPGSGLGALALPLGAAAMALIGLLGAGLLLYGWALVQVPILPVGDDIFVRSHEIAGDENVEVAS